MKIFPQYDLLNIFKIFIGRKKQKQKQKNKKQKTKKTFIDGNFHNKITKLWQVPCFCDVCLFFVQMKPFNHS